MLIALLKSFRRKVSNLIHPVSSCSYLSNGKYSNEIYWYRRGKNYLAEFELHDELARKLFVEQESVFVDVLKSIEFRSALELGCGFGRMLKLLLENFSLERLVGVDVSEDQIANARKLLKRFGGGELYCGNIKELDFPNNSFDLVYTSEVLMHIEDPEHILRNMKRISRKYVLNLEWQDTSLPFGPSPNAPWCFNHDYERLYQEKGLGIIREVILGKQQKLFLLENSANNSQSNAI